ncbi:MAG: chromosome segregation protein SMC [Thermodesulfobacteriota bacterium]
MKIKKINIHGFKSFVDKVEFNFPSGTSAIVGPNGCGKSNVVDAIRWVLGEHNPRHLRGKLMEDLIFNGSSGRKSLGMAEVSLTLSNDSGLAPARYADYSEIEIQRRLFRSGESEYYINKVPCRLKDIVEFFTDTGLGTSAYSIIEQGQVGWLINAKPVERRVLIEEAAGINKYKQKKDASIRKLDATQLNLTRVTDIISEVKRQLNSLNRQAKKAERYNIFKEELKGFDLYLASVKTGEMSEKKSAALSKCTTLADEELKVTTDIDTLETKIDSLRTEHLKKEDEYREVREKTDEIEKQLVARERDTELLTVRSGEIQRNEERLSAEIEEIRTKLVILSEESKGLMLEQEKVLGALTGLDARLTEKETEFEGLNRELRYKTELLSETEDSSIEFSTKLTEIKHAILTCARDEEGFREKEGDGRIKKKEITQTLIEKTAQVEELKESIQRSTLERDDLAEEITASAGKLKWLEGEGTELSDELKGHKEEWALKSSKLNTLEEMEANREGLDQGVKEIIEAGLSGERAGIHGIIADLIEPEAGFELAVEAVLGERLSHVIVEDQEAGLSAINFLDDSKHGRGSFLPLNKARLQAIEPGSKEAGLELLKDKIKVKEGYSKIIDYLLSNVVIAKDLESARAAWNQNGSKRIFVTTRGEMIGVEGAITGGDLNVTSSQAGGILQKRRQITEFKERVNTLTQEITSIEGSIELNSLSIDETGNTLEETQKKLHELDLGKVNLSGELKINEEEVSRLEEKEREFTTLIEEASNEIEGTAQKSRELSAQKDSLENELKETDEQIKTLTRDNASLADNKEKMTELTMNMKVERASLLEREESLKNLLKNKDGAINENELRIESKEREIEGGHVEKSMSRERTEELKVIIEELLEKKNSVKGLEVRGREVLSSMTEKIDGFEKELRSTRGKLSELQGSKNQASIELKELELALENLNEKIIERYGVTIDRYENTIEELNDIDRSELEERTAELRAKIAKLGDVSLSALEEFTELEERYTFLCTQKDDLTASVESLLKAIAKINKTTKERFKKAFHEINEKFQETFPKFFIGGKAELTLSDPDNILETGIEIIAQPPGKKLQNIMLLSGGEKALTATALIFAIFLIKPSPFCLLDEVDAPLDDANIERFNSFVHEMSTKSQFVLITHNKRTMEVADTLYGITMEEPGVSKAVTVQF